MAATPIEADNDSAMMASLNTCNTRTLAFEVDFQDVADLQLEQISLFNPMGLVLEHVVAAFEVPAQAANQSTLRLPTRPLCALGRYSFVFFAWGRCFRSSFEVDTH